MPIAFPQMPRGRPGIWAANLVIKPFDFVPAPNLGNPNFRFTKDTLGSGMGKRLNRANPGNPGVNFGRAFTIHDTEPRPQFLTDARLKRENDGTVTVVLTGVSRDSSGAAMGSCVVKLFRTVDDIKIAETISDGSGNYSFLLPPSGPYYLVEYKAGAPDLSGTSLNTLTPVPV